MNVLELIREKRTYLSNIVRRDANWVGHYLRRNCSLRDTIEGNMGEVKGMEREVWFRSGISQYRPPLHLDAELQVDINPRFEASSIKPMLL